MKNLFPSHTYTDNFCREMTPKVTKHNDLEEDNTEPSGSHVALRLKTAMWQSSKYSKDI